MSDPAATHAHENHPHDPPPSPAAPLPVEAPVAQTPLSTQAARVTASGESRLSDLSWQLWFDQLKQVSWLCVTAAAGTLVLLQAGYVPASRNAAWAVGAFALGAAVAVLGQTRLVDHLTGGKAIDRSIRAHLYVTLTLLGLGAGILSAMFYG